MNDPLIEAKHRAEEFAKQSSLAAHSEEVALAFLRWCADFGAQHADYGLSAAAITDYISAGGSLPALIRTARANNDYPPFGALLNHLKHAAYQAEQSAPVAEALPGCKHRNSVRWADYRTGKSGSRCPECVVITNK